MQDTIQEIRLPELFTPDTECCANCRYFVQHYLRAQVRGELWVGETFCGHCYHPRVKIRRRTDWCERFEQKRE